MQINKTLLLSSCLVSLCAQPVLSYEAGDIILRAGITHVAPNDDSNEVTLDGATLPVGYSELRVDGDTQLGLTASYMFNAHWGVELPAATPFNHTALGSGGLSGLDIADIKHLLPHIECYLLFQ